MGRASCALDPLSLFIGLVLTVTAEVALVAVITLVVSRDLFPRLITFAPTTLTLALGLSHTEFLGNKAVFDDLINVLFLSKRPLVVEIHISHLLADIGLVNALGMVTNEAVAHEALPDEASIQTCRVRCCSALLVTPRFDLIFIKKNPLAMYLLEGDIGR